MLNFDDLAGMGFQSAASIHHQAEAKRLAFEDRARFFADQRFAAAPVEWLNSKDYAAERARLIRPDRVMDRVMPGDAPHHGDTTYFSVADSDGMMVSWIQSNYRGMGSGLSPDGLGFMLQNRGGLFAPTDGHPNLYAPGKRPFQTIIPGFATRGGEPLLAFGVMGGDMQPQGQAQIISDIVDYGLDLQTAGDAPRWHHEGGMEPTGEQLGNPGLLRLESGAGGPGTFVDLVEDREGPTGRMGVGAVHHVAWRTADDAEQLALRTALLRDGLSVSEVRDRQYFHSIYFAEPGGVLFEVATDGPGFSLDEEPARLGRELKLPPWLEPERAGIAGALAPVTFPR